MIAKHRDRVSLPARGQIQLVGGNDETRAFLQALLLREGFDVVDTGEPPAKNRADADRPELLVIDARQPLDANAIAARAGELEESGTFELAAHEYERAAARADRDVNPERANKLQREAGRAYLKWAESTGDASAVRKAYAAAARAFLSAGSVKLAKESADRAKAVRERGIG